MITIELARKLRDAGFPQHGAGAWDVKQSSSSLADDVTYFPILEELIEACIELSADGDFHLEHLMKGDGEEWGAATCWLPVEKGEWFYGNDPWAAIARLWIALNKK